MQPRPVLVALLIGLAAGIALAALDASWTSMVVAVADTVGRLWLNAIRMTVIPLVASLLFVSVASVPDGGSLGRMGALSMAVFAALLVASATVAALVLPVALDLVPFATADMSSLANASEAIEVARDGASQVPGIGSWLVALVPVNPIAAAADGALLPLVLFTGLLAFATTRIGEVEREALLVGVRGLRDALLVLVRWVIALAPIGVFALTLTLAARLGLSAAGTFGTYVVILTVLLALQAALLYPLASVVGGVSLRQFAAAALPAQAVAASTRSSLAALPATIEGARHPLQLSRAAIGFVLPLAVSVFKFSAPLASISGTLFVARLYGVHLAPLQIALVALAAVALSFSTPGIPAGNLVVLAPIFATLGLPLEGLGLLIALDVIPDTVKTAANVTANLAVTAIVARLT